MDDGVARNRIATRGEHGTDSDVWNGMRKSGYFATDLKTLAKRLYAISHAHLIETVTIYNDACVKVEFGVKKASISYNPTTLSIWTTEPDVCTVWNLSRDQEWVAVSTGLIASSYPFDAACHSCGHAHAPIDVGVSLGFASLYQEAFYLRLARFFEESTCSMPLCEFQHAIE